MGARRGDVPCEGERPWPDGGRGGRNARLSELEVVNVKLHLPGAATQAAETDATQEQAGSGARWAVLRDERLHDADGEEEESVEDEEGGGGDQHVYNKMSCLSELIVLFSINLPWSETF